MILLDKKDVNIVYYSHGGEDKMKTVTLRMEDNVKDALDEMLDSMGMNIATFYNIYTLRTLRDRKIPFDITAPVDPFYADVNISQIKKAQQQIKNGETVTMSFDKLETMANE